jgi:hypothetical protein
MTRRSLFTVFAAAVPAVPTVPRPYPKSDLSFTRLHTGSTVRVSFHISMREMVDKRYSLDDLRHRMNRYALDYCLADVCTGERMMLDGMWQVLRVERDYQLVLPYQEYTVTQFRQGFRVSRFDP